MVSQLSRRVACQDSGDMPRVLRPGQQHGHIEIRDDPGNSSSRISMHLRRSMKPKTIITQVSGLMP